MRVNKTNNLVRSLWITVLLILSAAGFSHENEDEIIEREINQIIQIAIDAPELQQYYHTSELP